jgi:hypothetical protein
LAYCKRKERTRQLRMILPHTEGTNAL